MTEEVVDKRVKEKQVKVLRDLVTVNRESEPKCHWETGKAAKTMICKPGNLPYVGTGILSRVTSNLLY